MALATAPIGARPPAFGHPGPVDLTFDIRGVLTGFLTMHDPELMLAGPAGCIAGEMPIYDYRFNRDIPVRELWLNKQAPVVHTLQGPIQAEVPFRKGTADLYRIRFKSGREYIATLDHLFLSSEGWKHVACCKGGEQILVSVDDQARASIRSFPSTGSLPKRP
jgi:hypothetical protein